MLRMPATAFLLIALSSGAVAAQETISENPSLVIDGIDFGTDSGDYVHDGECDDPRFVGDGMTTTPLLAEDIKADASDCAEAYRSGKLKFNN